MYQPIPASSNALTLDDVIARLTEQDIIAGILTIGSTARHTIVPASDYDLLIILVDQPKGLQPYSITHIDGRFTDLLFATSADLNNILTLIGPVPSEGDWLGSVIRWFQSGEIIYDPTGKLAHVQHKVQTEACLKPLAYDGYSGWFTINYNLAQTRRLVQADDPVYRAAGELRLVLYAAPDLLFNYFKIRNLRWEGDKAAVRLLLQHDPDYWQHFQHFMRQGDPTQKLGLYERLAALTIAPVGELWPAGITEITVDKDAVSALEQESLKQFWEDLING
jgi:hypothetical protein